MLKLREDWKKRILCKPCRLEIENILSKPNVKLLSIDVNSIVGLSLSYSFSSGAKGYAFICTSGKSQDLFTKARIKLK